MQSISQPKLPVSYAGEKISVTHKSLLRDFDPITWIAGHSKCKLKRRNLFNCEYCSIAPEYVSGLSPLFPLSVLFISEGRLSGSYCSHTVCCLATSLTIEQISLSDSLTPACILLVRSCLLACDSFDSFLNHNWEMPVKASVMLG